MHVLSLVRLTAFAHTVGPLRVGWSVTGKSAQGRCLLHRYGLVAHLNPAASFKPAQRGVDALPGTSNPVREFFLRHLLADYAIIVPGLAKQHLRDTARPENLPLHRIRRARQHPLTRNSRWLHHQAAFTAGQRHPVTGYRRSGISDQKFPQDYRDPDKSDGSPGEDRSQLPAEK